MKFMLITSIGLLILFTSCTSTRKTAAYPESRPLLKAIQLDESKIVDSAKKIEDPEGTITLDKALKLALMQNPELADYSLEIRSREADALQQSLLPNPEIAIETENFAGSGAYDGLDATETTVSLGQLIELAGKREKRTMVAAFESDLAVWDFEALKLDIYASVVKRYTQVLALQEKAKLDSELLDISTQLSETVTRRVQAGGLSPAETARAQVIVSNAEISLQNTKRQLTAARKQLASTWNGKALFTEAQGTLETKLIVPPKEKLIEKMAQSPELARWTTEMHKRRSLLDLTKARAVPDPEISIAYRRLNESKDNTFMAGISIPLPVFDRNQGNIQQAQIRINQGEWEKETVRNDLNTKIESLLPIAEALATEITTLKQKSIPLAETAFSIISDGYQRGKFQLIDVLDAQRTLFETRRRLVESMADYKVIITELERLIGQDLQSL